MMGGSRRAQTKVFEFGYHTLQVRSPFTEVGMKLKFSTLAIASNYQVGNLIRRLAIAAEIYVMPWQRIAGLPLKYTHACIFN